MVVLIALACVGGLMLAPRAASAAALTTVSVSPSASAGVVGDALKLDGAVNGVTDLFDYQFDLRFDPTVLQADGISDGGFLASGGGTSLFGGALLLTLDNIAGLVTILDSLTGPAPPANGVTGSGILASVEFTAVASGTPRDNSRRSCTL